MTPGRIRPMTRRNRCPRGSRSRSARTAARPGGDRARSSPAAAAAESSRHDADDGRRLVVDENLPSDDRRIAAEAALRTDPSRAESSAARPSRCLRAGTCGRARVSAPSTWKKLVVTNAERSCSGSTVTGERDGAARPDRAELGARRGCLRGGLCSSGPESGPRGYPIAVLSSQMKTSRSASR